LNNQLENDAWVRDDLARMEREEERMNRENAMYEAEGNYMGIQADYGSKYDELSGA